MENKVDYNHFYFTVGDLKKYLQENKNLDDDRILISIMEPIYKDIDTDTIINSFGPIPRKNIIKSF